MTWYPDLSPCDYFGPEVADQLKAVGWLSRDKDYPIGTVSEFVFEKLCQLLHNPWNPAYCAGLRDCEFCRFTRENGQAHFKGYPINGTSSRCLFVPSDESFAEPLEIRFAGLGAYTSWTVAAGASFLSLLWVLRSGSV
jgi:hypothetical protein